MKPTARWRLTALGFAGAALLLLLGAPGQSSSPDDPYDPADLLRLHSVQHRRLALQASEGSSFALSARSLATLITLIETEPLVVGHSGERLAYLTQSRLVTELHQAQGRARSPQERARLDRLEERVQSCLHYLQSTGR